MITVDTSGFRIHERKHDGHREGKLACLVFSLSPLIQEYRDIQLKKREWEGEQNKLLKGNIFLFTQCPINLENSPSQGITEVNRLAGFKKYLFLQTYMYIH